MEWRNGIESNLDDVVQIQNVFMNVGKGQAASTEDLQKCFGSTDREKILIEILKKGELQVGQKEREHQSDNTFKDICTIISTKCVDPTTRRPYTVSMIERALQDMGFSIHANKSAKSQALDAIRQLKERKVIPIERARMRLRITSASKDAKRFKDKLMPLISKVDDEDWGEEYQLEALVDPGNYRAVTDLITNETKGKGHVELLDMAESEF